MGIVSRLITKCYLKGESFIYVFYDDVTLDLLRFEIKGNTKCRLSLKIEEPGLKEEINATGKIEQGKDVQIIEPVKQWKMVEEGGRLRTPPHLKFRAEWSL